MIRARLADAALRPVFHGGMSREEKDTAHEAFRRGTQVLVSLGGGRRGAQLPVLPHRRELRPALEPDEDRAADRPRRSRRPDAGRRDLQLRRSRACWTSESSTCSSTGSGSSRRRWVRSTRSSSRSRRRSARSRSAREATRRRRSRGSTPSSRSRSATRSSSRSCGATSFSTGGAFSATRRRGCSVAQPRATREDLEQFCRAAIGRFGRSARSSPTATAASSSGSRECFAKGRKRRRGGLPRLIRRPGGACATSGCTSSPWATRSSSRSSTTSATHGGCPSTVLESPEWTIDEPALLVDYRLELHGIRDSGCLLSYLVTEDGVGPAGRSAPARPIRTLEVSFPRWPAERVKRFEKMSLEAARLDAIDRFEAFKEEHAARRRARARAARADARLAARVHR